MSFIALYVVLECAHEFLHDFLSLFLAQGHQILRIEGFSEITDMGLFILAFILVFEFVIAAVGIDSVDFPVFVNFAYK